jgi:integrase
MSDDDDTEPPKTLQDAIDAFLRDLERRARQGLRSGATLVMHRAQARYIAQIVGATRPVAELTAQVIDSWSVRALEGMQGRPISGHTLTKYACTFRQVLQAAHRCGWIDKVPAFGKIEGRYRPRRQHLRDFEELQQLCATLPDDRADWVWLAVFTGQHPADIERMKAYTDCDPCADPPWVILRNTKNRTPGVVVEMPAPLAERLRERFTRLDLQPGQAVVPSWQKDNRSKLLRHRAAKLGIEACRASDLRRTCGSWAAHELGGLTIGLRDWMGHQSMKMLSLVYARALPPGYRDVAKALTAAAGKRRQRPPALPAFSEPVATKRRPPKRKTAEELRTPRRPVPDDMVSSGQNPGTHVSPPPGLETRLADENV